MVGLLQRRRRRWRLAGLAGLLGQLLQVLVRPAHLQLLLLLLQMAERGLGVRVLSRRHLDRGDGRRH